MIIWFYYRDSRWSIAENAVEIVFDKCQPVSIPGIKPMIAIPIISRKGVRKLCFK